MKTLAEFIAEFERVVEVHLGSNAAICAAGAARELLKVSFQEVEAALSQLKKERDSEATFRGLAEAERDALQQRIETLQRDHAHERSKRQQAEATIRYLAGLLAKDGQ